MLDELVHLNERFGARHFNFVDDTFTINKKVVEDFCHEAIAGGYQNGKNSFQWVANARANTVTKELLELIQQSLGDEESPTVFGNSAEEIVQRIKDFCFVRHALPL